MKTVRCAIYTRKSSEEGLEQSFNSLDAQREACAAYILSQASEGWAAVPDIYDDGGLSGGTLDRPALQRLLGDVTAGQIDIIVVYKVDRLTRSLLDFAKLVEAFDKAGTSFVSVTQSFNTTTSMGRLTLNMLLSFAQFEREVTAERIRDKIAASKARGMWMGGIPPLGYQPDGRSLKIVEAHAAIVHGIFERYLALGNVRRLAEALEREGIVAPRRTLTSGHVIGGIPLSRGQLYAILQNPIYIGMIPHRELLHRGNHLPIISQDLWDRVKAMLADNLQGTRDKVRSPHASLLAGRIVDAVGDPLLATHACKGNTRYRYYISKALNDGSSASGMRIPAREIEAAVAEGIAARFDDAWSLCADAKLTPSAQNFGHLEARCAEIAARLRQRDRGVVHALCNQVRVLEAGLEIDVSSVALVELIGMARTDASSDLITIPCNARLSRSGKVMRLVRDDGAFSAPRPNAPLVRLVLQARRWWGELRLGELQVTALAAREGVTRSYLTRVVRLAFLSPAVTDAIVNGGLRSDIDADRLTLPDAIDASWQRQAQALLPTATPA